MKRILIIGSSYLNYTYIMNKRYFEKKFGNYKGESVISKETLNLVEKNIPSKITGGGKGANQALALTRLNKNFEIDFLSVIGNDKNGRKLIDTFKKNKLNTENIMVTNKTCTNVTYNMIVNGENRMYGNTIKKSMNQLDKIVDDNIIKDLIKKSSIVVTHLEMSKKFFELVVEEAYKQNKKIIVDPNPVTNLYYLKGVMDKVTYLTPNFYEMINLEKTFDMNKNEIMKKFKNVIFTKGKNGVEFFDKNKFIYVPAIKIKSIDDTGAGDAFNGAFASMILKEYSLLESIKVANVYAGLKTTKLGADNLPTIDELKRYLFELKGEV